jgi:hypothetical protein
MHSFQPVRVLFAVLPALLLSACPASGGGGSTPLPGGDPTPRPAPAAGVGGGAAGSGFAEFYAYEPPRYTPAGPAPRLPVELNDVELPESLAERYGLGDAARETLARLGFVVTAPSGVRTDDFAEFYRQANQAELPIFVTADTALHLYHLVFDALLMTIEEQQLVGDLARMTALLRAAAAEAADDGGEAAEAARGNLAFCDVILTLLDAGHAADPRVAEAVRAEVDRIERHAGFEESAVFGYDEDFTQYIPRGHYTRTPALTRYFKAMMWLGRMSFLLKAQGDPAPDGFVAPADARRMARQAAQLAVALDETHDGEVRAAALWERIYRVTAFFAGFSDDLTPPEALPVVRELLGAAEGFQALEDPATADLLRARLAALRSPRIYSGTGGSAITLPPGAAGDPNALLEAVAATTGVRLMGQRYTPDADMMGRLIFPSVGPPTAALDPPPLTLVATDQGTTRGFSRGLDVLHLLGAPRARPILEQLGDAAYERFDEALVEAGRALPPSADDPAWQQNLYWAWLRVLVEYVAPRPVPTQAFEGGEAWAERTMTAALASWAQLRHDTILYVKQPYAVMITSAIREPPPPPEPKGFVEPHPELFARLSALNEMTRRGLASLDALPGNADQVLGEFGALLGTLRELAIKEIEDRAIDAADNDFLSSFGDRCGGLLDRIAALNMPPADEYGQRGTSAVDTTSVLVADVLTNPIAGQVLEEGTGWLEPLTVVMRAPGRGDLMAAVGPVLSYYEFRWPMADRLTDEQWRATLASPDAPPPPPWVCSYRTPCP